MRIIKGKPENFLVISGDDMLTLPIIAAGGSGLSQCCEMPILLSAVRAVNNALKNNFKAAREIHFRFMESIELLFSDGNRQVSSILSTIGLCQNNLRLPLVPVSKTVLSRIQKVVEELK